jgi:hypothetical protein
VTVPPALEQRADEDDHADDQRPPARRVNSASYEADTDAREDRCRRNHDSPQHDQASPPTIERTSRTRCPGTFSVVTTSTAPPQALQPVRGAILASAAMIFPSEFFLGMPFPLGILP